MIILGIDPGSIKTGYGVIEMKGKNSRLIECGVIRFDTKLELIDRLAIVYDEAHQLIKKYSPDEIALESLIFTKSVPSLAKLAQARGSLISGFGRSYQGKIFEYAPTLVKSTVTGHGQATKEGVEKTLKMIFGKETEFITDDASDAVAIALCHGLHLGVKKIPRVSKSKGRSLKSVFASYEGTRK